jgi:hypothetical protein
MAKKAQDKASSDGSSVASYFKAIFKENPTLHIVRPIGARQRLALRH